MKQHIHLTNPTTNAVMKSSTTKRVETKPTYTSILQYKYYLICTSIIIY